MFMVKLTILSWYTYQISLDFTLQFNSKGRLVMIADILLVFSGPIYSLECYWSLRALLAIGFPQLYMPILPSTMCNSECFILSSSTGLHGRYYSPKYYWISWALLALLSTICHPKRFPFFQVILVLLSTHVFSEHVHVTHVTIYLKYSIFFEV